MIARKFRLFSAVTGLSATLLLSATAAAHPKLVSSTPAAGAVVETPASLELHFNEKLIGPFSGLSVTMTETKDAKLKAPRKVDGVEAKVGSNGKTLVATLPKPLLAGTYKVAWHAVTSDTHRVQGDYTFQVR